MRKPQTEYSVCGFGVLPGFREARHSPLGALTYPSKTSQEARATCAGLRLGGRRCLATANGSLWCGCHELGWSAPAMSRRAGYGDGSGLRVGPHRASRRGGDIGCGLAQPEWRERLVRSSIRVRSASRAFVHALPRAAETRDTLEVRSVVEAVVARAVISIKSFSKLRGYLPRSTQG